MSLFRFVHALPPRTVRGTLLLLGLCSVSAAGLAGGAVYLARDFRPIRDAAGDTGATPAAPHSESIGAEEERPSSGDPRKVVLPKDTWETAGIRIGPASRGSFGGNIWVTGKVALNEDRLAHIHPLVEGRVDQVKVRFGDRVEAGDVLALVDSREVGRAKLDLLKSRLNRTFARVKKNWKQAIHENADSLIGELERGISIEQIDEKFRDKPMGEYRQQLLSAYARLHKSRADYERMKQLSKKGITPEKRLIAAKAALEADRATLQGLLEQIKHISRHQAILAEQDLQKAGTEASVNQAVLEILGYDAQGLRNIGPAGDGRTLAHYPVRSPFDGTVISKDVVLRERVGPETQLFRVADLSTVWIKADIYEKHLPLLQKLSDRTMAIRTESYPDRRFECRVFYTGEIVDPSSRTVGMTAVAENPERLLKPGQFVEVRLPAQTRTNVLQVPDSAVQTDEGRPFVFVHKGEDVFEKREVTTGQRVDGRVEITSGLEAGEEIAFRGAFVLKSRLASGAGGE